MNYAAYLIKSAVRPGYPAAVRAVNMAALSKRPGVAQTAADVGFSTDRYVAAVRRGQRESAVMGQAGDKSVVEGLDAARRAAHDALMANLNIASRQWWKELKQPFPPGHHFQRPGRVMPGEAARLAETLYSMRHNVPVARVFG